MSERKPGETLDQFKERIRKQFENKGWKLQESARERRRNEAKLLRERLRQIAVK